MEIWAITICTLSLYQESLKCNQSNWRWKCSQCHTISTNNKVAYDEHWVGCVSGGKKTGMKINVWFLVRLSWTMRSVFAIRSDVPMIPIYVYIMRLVLLLASSSAAFVQIILKHIKEVLCHHTQCVCVFSFSLSLDSHYTFINIFFFALFFSLLCERSD